MAAQKQADFLFHILVAALFILLLSGYFMRHTLSACLTSLVLAYLLNPLLKYLEGRGLSRIAALSLLYAILSAIVAVATFLLVPYLGQQLHTLNKALPYYMQNVESEVTKWQVNLASYYSGEEGIWLLERGKESLDRLIETLSGMGYNRLTALLYAIFNLVLAPILVFFMLLYKQHSKDLLKRLIPLGHRRQMIELGRRINRSLEGFIIGMFIDSLLVGLLTALALWMVGFNSRR